MTAEHLASPQGSNRLGHLLEDSSCVNSGAGPLLNLRRQAHQPQPQREKLASLPIAMNSVTVADVHPTGRWRHTREPDAREHHGGQRPRATSVR